MGVKQELRVLTIFAVVWVRSFFRENSSLSEVNRALMTVVEQNSTLLLVRVVVGKIIDCELTN